MLKYVFVFLLAFAVTALAKGDDSTSRERRVKVALALETATVDPVAEVAPAPTAKKWPNFADGFELAAAESKVLVVYIGCGGSHPINAVPGAVVATQNCLAPYSKGTILIAYPFGKDYMEHKTLKCQDFATVAKEVEVAAKKKENTTTADKAIAKPLDWSMTAACDFCSYCGANCKCKDRSKCPSGCPLATEKCDKCKDDCTCPKCDNKCEKKVETPAVVVTQPTVTQQLYYVRDKYGNYHLSTCPNGICPPKN